MPSTQNPSADLIDRCASIVRQAIGSRVPDGAPVILLDVPTHMNVGDHAISLGEFTIFDQLGLNLVYAAYGDAASLASLASRFPDAVVLLHGGGNLGDLWPAHQEYRELTLAHFKHNRVIQLPQSLAFEAPEAIERAKASFSAHPDLTLLLRDRRGFEFAQSTFDCASELCPDSAFALGPQPRTRTPDREVLYLARGDHERTSASLQSDDAVDWPYSLDRVERRLARLAEWLSSAERRDRRPPLNDWVLPKLLERLAAMRVAKGFDLLSRGESVVSDRLHAHILCLLLGIPHTLTDTRSGKVHDFVDTWTASSPLVTRAAAAEGQSVDN